MKKLLTLKTVSQAIQISQKLFNENQCIALTIKTEINIHNAFPLNPRKELLIKSFYKQINKINLLNIEKEKLVEFIKTACEEAKSTDGLPM